MLDDATGLALINPHENNDGQERFPFGGSVGDLTLTDVVVNVSVRGELTKAAELPISPYHRYRQAFFTQRSTAPCEPSENLFGFGLSVGSVDLNLNPTALAALFHILVAEPDAVGIVEDAIEDGLEGLDDFGSVGDAIAGALTPFLPDAAALQTHDLFKPFTDEHVLFTYDRLRIEGEGQGIHILNHAPEPVDSDPPGGGTHVPDPPTDFDPPILDQADPIPFGGWTHDFPADSLIPADGPLPGAGKPLPKAGGADSPLGDLVLAADQRPRYVAHLNAASEIPPIQEAAARLWLDGVPPDAIAWIRASDVDRKAKLVAGRPVSIRTLASLDRLAASGARQPGAFFFATSPSGPPPAARCPRSSRRSRPRPGRPPT